MKATPTTTDPVVTTPSVVEDVEKLPTGPQWPTRTHGGKNTGLLLQPGGTYKQLYIPTDQHWSEPTPLAKQTLRGDTTPEKPVPTDPHPSQPSFHPSVQPRARQLNVALFDCRSKTITLCQIISFCLHQ